MKSLSNLIFFFVIGGLLVTACNKEGKLPFYKAGTAITLNSSTTTIAPAAADSANTAVTFTWSNPQFSIDSTTAKYVLQMDTTGGNFVTAVSKNATGTVSTSFTAQDLNNILVTNFGYGFNATRSVDVRVLASYPNNNDQKISNTVTIKVTPYAVPFALNASGGVQPFFISLQNKDSALETFTWHAPNYNGAKLAYSVQFDTAGHNFSSPKTISTSTDSSLLLTGVALNNYAAQAGIANGATGAIDFRVATTINGLQTAYSNVQTIKVSPNVLLAFLYVAGDYQGWSPSTAPDLASTDGSTFEGYVNISTTGGFKLTSAPDWNHTNYGDAGSGKISTTGGNLNIPAAGYYRLQANTTALTWSATATTWGIIGDATPGGWGASTELTFDATTNTWTIASIALNSSGSYKFRANDAWDINLGGDPTKLSYNGGNLSVPQSGNYKVVLDLSHAPNYTCTLTKL